MPIGACNPVVCPITVLRYSDADAGGWSPYFGDWGISMVWLELIRADVLVVKGRYSDFLEVSPITTLQDDSAYALLTQRTLQDGGTDVAAVPPPTTAPPATHFSLLQQLQHRASLQRAGATIAMWYGKEPQLKRFASAESDSARLILLKLLHDLPLERVLRQPAPPALPGTATAGSAGYALGLVKEFRAYFGAFLAYFASPIAPSRGG